MEEEQNVQVNEATNTHVERKGFNITSMILGIISVVFSWLWYVSLPCSIIAIIFSVAGKNSEGRGMGVAGLVLGIISLVIYFAFLCLGLFAISSLASM